MDQPRKNIPGKGHTKCKGARPAGKEPRTCEGRKDSHSGQSAENEGGQTTRQGARGLGGAGKQRSLQLRTQDDPSPPALLFRTVTGKNLDSGLSQMRIKNPGDSAPT